MQARQIAIRAALTTAAASLAWAAWTATDTAHADDRPRPAVDIVDRVVDPPEQAGGGRREPKPERPEKPERDKPAPADNPEREQPRDKPAPEPKPERPRDRPAPKPDTPANPEPAPPAVELPVIDVPEIEVPPLPEILPPLPAPLPVPDEPIVIDVPPITAPPETPVVEEPQPTPDLAPGVPLTPVLATPQPTTPPDMQLPVTTAPHTAVPAPVPPPAWMVAWTTPSRASDNEPDCDNRRYPRGHVRRIRDRHTNPPATVDRAGPPCPSSPDRDTTAPPGAADLAITSTAVDPVLRLIDRLRPRSDTATGRAEHIDPGPA
ncbi:hypothetical protein [Verrucosispora sp. WMMD1129]|uniref:hypothetical protein n=1 Tax=Verrucosispora sp. WMMD1129 TaxID=3016093 RepID=UPI00249BA0DB|nr:hypothetical protein [Verrucosispora sp. WMMD1129]WFE45278.1 hypothetical protein O7624_13435 [Verrucosispora sp. WMMD1129]